MQTTSTPPKPKPTPKARPLPPTHRPAKRPLLHPPQPPRTIYISSRTPFVSAVKRAQKFLDAQKAANAKSAATTKGATATTKSVKVKSVDVTLKASGKAIDMALQVALYFQGAYVVRISTGGVAVVDDVVRVGEEVEGFGGKRRRGGEVEKEGEGGEVGEEKGEEMEGVEEEEMEDITMRERRISTIEIVISAKEKQV
ncbi:uncharacterized protein H6S33_010146 [Morchella sextelata]|uniref:uncharacterized protein n=1 Tax=Morchella sextelata TaxID=1174677 RepID=UPI001D038795|nr:uncharacterized protein H6S33_010146 [Morchella sextelata]KAH0612094.1 hypothetical protein H6S33_010146 [Morchella sextelata]